MSIVTDLARQGLGLTLANPDYTADYLADGSLVQVLSDYHISTLDEAHGRAMIQYRRPTHLSRAARAFVEYLIEHMPGDRSSLTESPYAARSSGSRPQQEMERII